MRIPLCLAAAALAASLQGCGDPPDDVADAARQSRAAVAQSREEPVANSRQPTRGDRPAASTPRPLARDLPPGAGRTASVAPPPMAAPDRSTAVMGAGPGAGTTLPQPAASASAVPDAAITAHVRSVLGSDREIGPLHLDVDTRDGVVTLSGTVPTAAARARAGDLAKSVKDVKSVNDQLTLATG